MPSSDASNISLIVSLVQKLEPTSILDVGVGNGKYGLLFREYLDSHYQGHAFHDPSTWTLRLDGVEIFEKYITPVHEYIYSKIFISDISVFTPPRKYGLVFLGDLIEHLEKGAGLSLLMDLSARFLEPKGVIIVSTPNFRTSYNDPQLAVFGNTAEVHKCRWFAKDFDLPGFKVSAVEGKLLTVVMEKQ